MNEDKDIWEQLPRAEVAEEVMNAAKNPPAEVTINVTVSGVSAARIHFVRTLLMTAFNLTQDEADKYLIRGGAAREIERLGHFWNKAQGDRA